MKVAHVLASIVMFISLIFASTGNSASQSNWEQDWEGLVAKGKKEGKVSVYSLWSPGTREALRKAFQDKFGIALEFTTFSRGGELLAKVQAEQRAGLHLVDIFGAGAPTLVADMKPAGVLGFLEPLLLLPEVRDPKLWQGSKLPYLDKDKRAVGIISSIQRHLAYNTNMARPEEVTTYKDALNPKFKNSITMVDPSVAGAGNSLLAHLAHNIWTLDEAMDFFKKLIRQQNVVLQRDGRLHVETVAKGKYAIGLAPAGDLLNDFMTLGAPLATVVVKEGTFVSVGTGALAVPTNFANPNAAKVFMNWLLSRDGQKVFTKGYGFPSTRIDVTTEGINPIFLPRPGEKLFLDSEDQIIFRGKMQALAKKAMEDALK